MLSPKSSSMEPPKPETASPPSDRDRQLSWRELICWVGVGCGIIASYYGINKSKENKEEAK